MARASNKMARSLADVYRVDYEYGLNRYSSTQTHNLGVAVVGRLGDGRFSLLANSGGAWNVRNAAFTLERPNGQRFVAGDLGTGANLQFLSAYIRGAAATIPLGRVGMTAFAGRAVSGALDPVSIDETGTRTAEPTSFRYDTTVAGVSLSTNSSLTARHARPLNLSAGALRFAGASRSGQIVASGFNYAVPRLRVQGDIAYGTFSGRRSGLATVDGPGAAVDVSGTFEATEDLSLQARYAYVGASFLTPQQGTREPTGLAGVGLSWSPVRWLSASFNASMDRRPDQSQSNKYATTALSISPGGRRPGVFISHTQSVDPRIGPGTFTVLNASKELSRLRLFLNSSRIKSIGPASVNMQLGAAYSLSDHNALIVSQGVGRNSALNGQFDWHASGLLKQRLSLSAGVGYTRAAAAGFDTYQRVSASVDLPRLTTVQASYYQTNAGPSLVVSVRATIFRKSEGRAFLDSPASAMNSSGRVTGRVYQDVDQNGRFDEGVDKPQADVKVRVDGNRYVVSDKNGLYEFDSVAAGDHKIYIDLLTVRADLTLLGDTGRDATLLAGHGTAFDFRLVRTGRMSGRVWLDVNENGKMDEGERPLADVRVMLANGRDSFTNEDGYFVVADLPPGVHTVELDAATLPEKTMPGSKEISINIFAGRETGGIELAAIAIPAEIKRFGGSGQK